ncbi:Integral membrane protein [Histomonas meleagridis]|uniref:Integral membrane protein n=1 Tax=Histomonas meleagridis TaxID=135588 RepID=UPI00355ABBCD|nr:Integral membrane protein [Histomonas meleagridis]KAH0802377.1 Integral membrane protein [Histomonas meleagridis]
MKCSPLIAISFIFCAVAYGASSAAVTQALKTFTPELIIVFRMLFGFGFCLIVFLFRLKFERGYVLVVKQVMARGFMLFVHITIGGLFNLAIPHSLIAIAQQWIPSAAVQMCKPVSPTVSQIISHFIFPDERFNLFKLFALLSSIVGVVLTAIPSFNHTTNEKSTTMVAVGYILLIVAVILLGVASVYFKWKATNVDITISCMVQTFTSFIFDMIWSLIMDGPQKIKESCEQSDWLQWMWPLMLGVFASGVAVHGFMYLVNNVGAVGANFVPFGQIIVGVALGVFWLKEWSAYVAWEIAISVLGLVLLAAAIFIGFCDKSGKKNVEEEEEEEEEKDEHPEEEDKHVHLSEI